MFIQLENTNEKTISPEYDLAYMALLNEKDEEDAFIEAPAKDKQATQVEDTSTNDKQQRFEADTKYTTADADSDDITEALISTPINKTLNDNIPSNFTDKLQTEEETRSFTESAEDAMRPASPPPAYNEISNKHRESLIDQKSKPKTPVKTKERPSVDSMMFGTQQDVTECMGNVMYLVEAALKPLKKTEDGEQVDDMIRQVFYGKARQILSYCDNATLKTVKKEMEEDFSHVIVDASEGKDLYDGLDEYFFADQVENFQGGHEATREVTVKSFPPVLQILVQVKY